VALPDQLFYNTGISTYIWILSNKKSAERKGKVQLIDARQMFNKMRKSLGDKRKELQDDDRRKILELYSSFKEGRCVKVFDTKHFGYRQITIERPLRLSFRVTSERIELLKANKIFAIDSGSKKKPAYTLEQQEAIFLALQKMAELPACKNREDFIKMLITSFKSYGALADAKLQKLILGIMSEHDEQAAIILDSKGQPEADSDLRDTENIPLDQDLNGYFDREVIPFVPKAWINAKVVDHKDGRVGKVGYEIPFTRFFYKYKPPRDLKEIEADIQELETELAALLKQMRQ
jgi:type I restriction enzyme M protein